MGLADSWDRLKESLGELKDADLDVNDLGSWPTPIKVMLCVLIFLLVLIFGYFFVISDQQTELARATAQEETLKSQFRTRWAQTNNLEAYQHQVEEMKSLFGDLLRQLPTDTEVPGLLEDITAAGRASNLQFDEIKLLPEQVRDFYVELPIEIIAVGSYHDLATFVGAVASLPRIVTLHDFTIQVVGAGSFGVRRGQSLDPNKLRMTITAKTYRYKDQGSSS